MKNIIWSFLIIILTFTASMAQAQMNSDVCFTGEGGAPLVSMEDNTRGGSNIPPLLATDYMAAGPQCKDLEPYIATLNATSYAFYITSTSITCFGGPLTVNASLVLFGSGFILESLNFIVKNIPCEPNIPKEIIDKRVEEKVCAVMQDNGFNCRNPARRP